MIARKFIDAVRQSVVHITVLENDDVISFGTGFIFLPDGHVLTAAHTIAGGWPIKSGEIDLANRKIIVRCPLQNLNATYRPKICPIVVRFPSAELLPITLDVAIIAPTESASSCLHHLEASVKPPLIGDEIVMGGYSDELIFPFDVHRIAGAAVDGVSEFRKQWAFDLKGIMASPMLKRGMVGNAAIGSVSSGENDRLVTWFLVDNQMHSGASGGPIVDTVTGEAKGIIIRRTMTECYDEHCSKTLAPAGSTLGLGLDVLTLTSM